MLMKQCGILRQKSGGLGVHVAQSAIVLAIVVFSQSEALLSELGVA
jgi:hypothetical protein